uniref:Sigma factor for late transcription n=1 Tax=Pseudomonas phage Cygsa01 TaxID=3138529 RepID=A0AAU6W3Z1_9VIRU
MAEKFDITDIDSLSLDLAQTPAPRQHYVDNEKLSAALSEWRLKCNAAKEQGLKRPMMPNYVGEAIMKISRNVATRYNYNRYSYKDEMISDAIENCCAYLHNFDPFAITRSGKPNAFSYITRIVMNTFGNRIQFEQRQEYYKLKMFELVGGFAALGDEESADALVALEESGITQDFMTRIAEYEAKMQAIREKNAAKQLAANPKPSETSIFDAFFVDAEEPVA